MRKICKLVSCVFFSVILLFSTSQNTYFATAQANDNNTNSSSTITMPDSGNNLTLVNDTLLMLNNTSIQSISEIKTPKPYVKEKFDQGFDKKITDMMNAGESRDYEIIVLVKRTSENEPNTKLVAKQNKDKLEDALLKIHKAKDVYKGKILSLVTARVPLNEIYDLTNYDSVIKIGDGELKVVPEMDVARPTVNAMNLLVDGNGVKVAVIDTGIRQDHLDLPVGTKIIGQTVCSSAGCASGDFSDDGNHGTHVAGIIAGTGNITSSLKGIASGASLLNAKYSSDSTAAWLAKALDWSLNNGAKVINLSLFVRNNATDTNPNTEGICANPDHISNLMADEAFDEGAVIIKSAGNKGNHTNGVVKFGTITNPGCGFNVIAVGGINDQNSFPDISSDNIEDFSSRGPFDGRLKPEIVAPAVRINSPDQFLNYDDFAVTGTSFAAAITSGASALVLQAHQEYTPLEVKAALLAGAKWNPKNITPIPTTASEYESGGSSDTTLNAWGFGLLDVNKTLTLANTGKNIKLDTIAQNQIKKYSFSANQNEQVKVILSWLKHTVGNVTNPFDNSTSNLNFDIKLPNGTLWKSSNSANQNNEFVVYNAPVNGNYTITISAQTVNQQIGGAETFALASTHALSKGSFFVKEGTFTKALLGSSQFARPDVDNAVGGWTTTPLWQKLDETTPDDGDFVTSPSGTAPEFQVGLSDVTDPTSSTGHIIKFRAKASVGSGAAEKANAILFQGTTQIAQTGLQALSRTSFTQFQYTLTSAEADAITDYNNLSIKIVTSKANTEVIQVSWIEFVVPPVLTNQSITGLGFKPKAVLLFTTGQTAEGSTDEYNFAIGYSDGTNSRSIGVASDDDIGNSNAGRAFGTKILRILSSGMPTVAAEADLISYDPDGFTMKWTTNDSTQSVIHYIALGGDDLTNSKVSSFAASTTTGQQAVSGVGFQPDLIMFMHTASTTETSTESHGYLSYGFATASKRGAVAVTSEDGRANMDTWRTQRTDRAIVTLPEDTGTPIDGEADIVSMDANGFTINWLNAPASADRIYYLALKGGQYDVGNFVKTTTSAPVTQTVNIGFQPKGLILLSFNDIAATTVQPNNRLSFGAADSTIQSAIWAGDKDGVADSITARSTTTSKVIRLATEQATMPPPPPPPGSAKVVSLSESLILSDTVSVTTGGSFAMTASSTAPLTEAVTEAGTGSIDSEANLISMNPTNFTINWTTNDSIAKQILYVAFGRLPDFNIIVVEETIPDSPTDFQFTSATLSPPSFSLDDDTNTTLSNTKVFQNLLPDTYDVAQAANPSYITSSSCSDGSPVNAINVGLDETVTCKFVNTKKGTITIVKDTVPDDATNFNFTSNTLSPSSFSLDDDSDPALSNTRTFGNLVLGTYDVSETSSSSYTTTATCSDGSPPNAIQVSAGETVTCTFRNESVNLWQYREHDVYVDWDPAWTFTKEGTEPKRILFSIGTGPNQLGAAYLFKVFNKADITGRDIKITWQGTQTSNCCDSATFEIVDGAYDRTSSTDFPSNANRISKGNGTLGAVSQSASWGSVTQTISPNWQFSTSNQVTIFVDHYDLHITGGHILYIEKIEIVGFATYIFHDPPITPEVSGTFGDYGTYGSSSSIAPSYLTVIKNVVNNSGRSLLPNNFTMHVSGFNPNPADFAGTTGSGTLVSLSAGTYGVSEEIIFGKTPGYAGSFSADCSGSILVGQNKTCTVTNDDHPLGGVWEFREHDIYTQWDPAWSFSKDSSRIAFSTGTTPLGAAYLFRTFDKADITGRNIIVTWQGQQDPVNSGPESASLEVVDGSYDRVSFADFPPDANRISKGNGTLGGFGRSGSWSNTTDTLSPNWNWSTSNKVTIFVNHNDLHIGGGHTLYIQKIEIVGFATYNFGPLTQTTEVSGSLFDQGRYD